MAKKSVRAKSPLRRRILCPFIRRRLRRLFGDRFVVTYGAGEKDWHVAALDAKTGARQWDVVLKHGTGADALNGMTCSATRVYVAREEAVDVLDAATGRSLGTIGAD